MLHKHGGFQHRLEWWMVYFIIFQPLLDITHTLSSGIFGLNTLSVMVRMVAMILGFGYIIYRAKEQKNRKVLYYFLILGIVVIGQLAIGVMTKENFLITSEIKFLSKIIYFPIMLITYVLVFSSLRQKSEVGVKKYITYAMLITGLVMVISTLTSTNLPTYSYEEVNLKIGSTGWFFAGNELGSFLAICFPIVVLSSIKMTTSSSRLYYWIPSILMIVSLIAIGTKVAYGALIIILLIALLMCIKDMVLTKKPFRVVNTVIVFVLLAGSFGVIPFAPIYKSAHVSLEKAGYVDGELIPPPDQEVGEEIPNDSGVTSLIYSGRNKFLLTQEVLFDQAAFSQKLFGLGHQAKIVERDFHDIFFTFGVLGFILIFLPLAYYGFLLIFDFFSNFKKILSLQYVLTISSLLISVGVAFIAGHVLLAPAVSIYFAFILAHLVSEVEI